MTRCFCHFLPSVIQKEKFSFSFLPSLHAMSLWHNLTLIPDLPSLITSLPLQEFSEGKSKIYLCLSEEPSPCCKMRDICTVTLCCPPALFLCSPSHFHQSCTRALGHTRLHLRCVHLLKSEHCCKQG